MPGPLLQITFTGKSEVANAIKKARGIVGPAMRAGIYQLGCAVISDSIPRAPKDTGTLRNSAYCELPRGGGDTISVRGGYGGFAKAYALTQHEDNYRHTEGGKKYLERSFKQFKPNAAKWLGDFIAKAMDSGSQPGLNSMGVQTAPGPKGTEPKKKRPRKKKVKRKGRKR